MPWMPRTRRRGSHHALSNRVFGDRHLRRNFPEWPLVVRMKGVAGRLAELYLNSCDACDDD
jgi:hypothetical protein